MTAGKVIGWIAGIVGAVIAGVIVVWLTSGGPQTQPTPTRTRPSPTATAPAPTVWREGDLTIPVSAGNSGRVADLDAGRLLPLGTSIPASDADIIVRQTPHSVVIEPGLSKGDGVTFDARFTAVSDGAIGRDACADAAISPQASNHLQLSSDIDVRSHVCMVTTNDRLAEFEIVRVDLSSTAREVEIAFVVWASD